MIEQRVAALEADMKEVRASLKAIELAVAEIKHLPKVSDFLSMQKELGDIKGKLGAVEGRIQGLEGRFSQLPTTWSLLTFTIGSVLASAGLAFTIARLFVR